MEEIKVCLYFHSQKKIVAADSVFLFSCVCRSATLGFVAIRLPPCVLIQSELDGTACVSVLERRT